MSRLPSQFTRELYGENNMYGGLLQGYGNVNCTTREEVVFWSPFCLELAFAVLRSSSTSILTSTGSYQGFNIFYLYIPFFKFDL